MIKNHSDWKFIVVKSRVFMYILKRIKNENGETLNDKIKKPIMNVNNNGYPICVYLPLEKDETVELYSVLEEDVYNFMIAMLHEYENSIRELDSFEDICKYLNIDVNRTDRMFKLLKISYDWFNS